MIKELLRILFNNAAYILGTRQIEKIYPEALWKRKDPREDKSAIGLAKKLRVINNPSVLPRDMRGKMSNIIRILRILLGDSRHWENIITTISSAFFYNYFYL